MSVSVHTTRRWLRGDGDECIATYHPMILGFEKSLKNSRLRIIDIIRSSCRITLPFQVQTHVFEKFNLRWTECSARVPLVELLSSENNYAATTQDNTLFEIC